MRLKCCQPEIKGEHSEELKHDKQDGVAAGAKHQAEEAPCACLPQAPRLHSRKDS